MAIAINENCLNCTTLRSSGLRSEWAAVRLRELAAQFRAAIDADLARQDVDIEDREVERDSDLE